MVIPKLEISHDFNVKKCAVDVGHTIQPAMILEYIVSTMLKSFLASDSMKSLDQVVLLTDLMSHFLWLHTEYSSYHGPVEWKDGIICFNEIKMNTNAIKKILFLRGYYHWDVSAEGRKDT